MTAPIASYIVIVAPGRSGTITQGFLSEGSEYCVVETDQDLGEPYQVSVYIRDSAGIWHWN